MSWQIAPLTDVRQYEYVEALPQGCTPLLLEGEQHSFDLSADWFRLLENKTIFPEINARYYTLERGNKVLGLLPLSLQHAGGRVNQVSGLDNFYSSLYRPLLAPSVTSGELAACLKKILADTGMDILRFNAMDPAYLGFKLLESAIHQAGLKPFRFFCFGNWYLPVEGRSFAVYFQGLSSKVQSTIKRREKKFLADGRGRLEIVTGGDRLNDVIEAWDKIYRTSWKIPEPFTEFVPGFIRMCATRGWLRLGFAYYDNEPIAAQLWIVSHGRAAIYKLAYDEKFSQLSPGTVLTAHLMCHVLDVDKVTEVDYLVGDDAYKKDWMSHRRERWGIVAYNPYTLGGVAGIAVQMIGKVRKSLLKKISTRTTHQPPSQSIQHLANCNNAMLSGEAGGNAGWTILPLENNLGSYKEIWDKLNAELYSSNPYFDSSFIEPLLAYFSAGRARICIFRRENEIDGLVIVVSLRLGKWSLFVPAQAQIAPILVRHPENLQGLIHALPGLSLVLDLPCQDTLHSPSLDEKSLLFGPVQHAHTMGVKLDGDFKGYWDVRSANLRKSMGRRLRKAQDAGFAVRLNHLTEPGDMQSVIARFGEMESAGWKGRGGTAVHADNAQGRFYTDVLRRFAKRGKASVYELYFNDTLIAMQLCIASPSMLVLLKTTYDESQAVFSPGRLLLYLLLEEEFAEKRVQTIEFYTNADSDGLAWATHDRWISHYMLFSNSFVRETYQILKLLKHRL